jgi:hypothetical protein
MIAHVAEVGEHRGRVVLHLGAGRNVADVAIDAAVRIAQAFQSEIETLVVQDQQLVDFASFSFAREISRSGRTSRSLSAIDMEQDLKLQSAALHRRVAAVARMADVRTHARVVRDEPLPALARACSERGPWNVVTLGRTLDAEGSEELQELFYGIEGTTGFVVTGPKALRTEGPVIAIIEDLERVPPMLRAAERLASATGGEAKLWLIANDAEELDWMDGQARLALGLAAPATMEGFVVDSNDVDGAAGTLADLLRDQAAGFVISRFGGRLAPEFCSPGRPAGLLECPLFLVR